MLHPMCNPVPAPRALRPAARACAGALHRMSVRLGVERKSKSQRATHEL